MKIKKKIKDELLNFRSTYDIMDDIFIKEIRYAEENQNKWSFCFSMNWCNKTKNNKYQHLLQDASPIIYKFYNNLLDDN